MHKHLPDAHYPTRIFNFCVLILLSPRCDSVLLFPLRGCPRLSCSAPLRLSCWDLTMALPGCCGSARRAQGSRKGSPAARAGVLGLRLGALNPACSFWMTTRSLVT